MKAPSGPWYRPVGHHATLAFGLVPRFQCLSCRKTFSSQTFSIDYWAKKKIDYRRLLVANASSESGRAIARSMDLSCGTVINRIDRLSRQAAALHAELRVLADPRECVCIDGLVDFDVSQYFPCEIALSITSASRFVLDLSHATRRRSGRMTEKQQQKAKELYAEVALERGAVARSFRDLLDSLARERPPSAYRPLIVITDEKKEYERVFFAHPLFREQDEEHRAVHIRVSSKLPRTMANPLFPSNYLEREIRKDQANHHRETTCFPRNASNGMARLLCYLVEHNYEKRFLVKARKEDRRTHAEAAGIAKEAIDAGLAWLLRKRVFLTRIELPPTLERIWRKTIATPGKIEPNYLPRFALG
jgi:hypothetical protein